MFKNRKWIGVSLITLLVVAVLGFGGWSLYRLGFNRGVRIAQTRAMPMVVEMETRPFNRQKAKENGAAHPFLNQGRGQGQRVVIPEGGFHGQLPSSGTGLIDRRAPVWTAGSWIIRLLFTAGMFGLVAYVVVKLFQPGGWQLTFGPLQSPVEEDSKSGSKGKK